MVKRRNKIAGGGGGGERERERQREGEREGEREGGRGEGDTRFHRMQMRGGRRRGHGWNRDGMKRKECVQLCLAFSRQDRARGWITPDDGGQGRNERCKVIKANVHHLVGDLKARNFLWFTFLSFSRTFLRIDFCCRSNRSFLLRFSTPSFSSSSFLRHLYSHLTTLQSRDYARPVCSVLRNATS